MITLSQIEKKAIEDAIAKAEKEGLEVVQALGGSNIFQVISGGNTYTVVFEKVNGVMRGECNCKAGKINRKCKHLVLAGRLYKEQLQDKAEAKAEATTAIATKTNNHHATSMPEATASNTDQSTSPALVSGVAPVAAPEANEPGCSKCGQPLTKTNMGYKGRCNTCWNVEVAKNEADLWG
ncbi:MAG: hypothetical protein HXX20_02080 [Chloroflexi bacterium]|nr:hypothetical protein [Chloroflexota bacterium]